MEDVLIKLSPELKSNYSLVYESRSPIGASLKTPRVVLMNKDASVMISFAGSSDMRGGHQLEIIERGNHLEPFRFKRIDFSKPASERIEYAPSNCMGCHGIKGTKLGMRPIWDTYPDWPGMYGSSHSGEVVGNMLTGRQVVGTSTMPILDFEKQAFSDFQKNSAQQGRYQILADLPKKSLKQMAESNTRNTELIAKSNFERLKQVIKNLPPEMTLEEFVYLDIAFNQKRALSAKPDYRQAKKGISDYYESKRTRIKEIVAEFGSKADRAAMVHNLPAASIDADTIIYLKKNKIAALTQTEPSVELVSDVLEYLQTKLGINPSDLSYTREAGSYSFNTGLNGGNIESELGPQIRTQLYQKMRDELELAQTPEAFHRIFEVTTQVTGSADQLLVDFSGAYFKSAESSPIESLNALFKNPKISTRIKRYFFEKSLAQPYTLTEFKALTVPLMKDENGFNSTKSYFKKLSELSESKTACMLYYLKSAIPRR
jgi:hypothetical protein